jgi:hypothetical protein
MTKDTLKRLRTITPGVIVAVYFVILGQITGLWNFPVPNIADLEKAPIPIIIGFLYYILPFRSRMNSVHYNHIIELLRSKLVEIAGVPDNANLYNWILAATLIGRSRRSPLAR